MHSSMLSTVKEYMAFVAANFIILMRKQVETSGINGLSNSGFIA